MEDVSRLIKLVYDSVADTAGWQIFLDAFVRAVRSTRGSLLIADPTYHSFGFVRSSGSPPEDVQLFVDRYAAIDPLNAGLYCLPEGAVASDEELCPRKDMLASASFREFYAPRDCMHGMGGAILVTDTGRSIIGAIRGAAAGPFGETEKDTLRALMPHLRLAALLHGEIGSLRAQLATFTGHLDRSPLAFLLIDSESRVLYSNPASREITDRKDALTIEGGIFSLRSSKDDAAFRKKMSTLASASDVRHLEVSRPSHKMPYRLMLTSADSSGAVPLGVSLPAVSVLIIDGESKPNPDTTILRELFSLTPAEARVAGKLLQGLTLDEIAAESKVSVETIRSHVKRILSKTATTRQSELILLILRSLPLL
jgi:DNA-binding CsgD family transcriptional regulator